MKKTFLVAIPAALLGLNTLAQGAGRLDLPTVYVQNTVTGSNNMPTNVLGSPYLNEEFQIGTVTIKGSESYQTYVRYNAFNDEIEMRNGNTTSAVMKRNYITVNLAGEVFSIHPYDADGALKQGYFNALNKGSMQLLRRRTVELKEGSAASSSYSQDKPPKFELKQSYYLTKDGEKAKMVRLNKKGILNALSDRSTKVNAFVKKNKLKLKSEVEVIKLLDYYNSL